MPYNFPKFKNTTDSLGRVRDTLCESHGVANISDLRQPRNVQLGFLVKVKEMLQANESQNANQIMIGASLFIQHEIAKTYGMRSANNSTLHSELHNVTGHTKEAPITTKNQLKAAKAFQTYLVSVAYVEGNKDKELLERHAFSDIDGFNLNDCVVNCNAFVTNVSEKNQEEIKAAEAKAEQKRLAEAAKKNGESGGLFSWLGAGNAQNTQDKTQTKDVKQGFGL